MRTHSVSAATVHAALARLSAEGLVETRPGDGTFSRPPREVVTSDVSWQTAALGPLPFAAPPGDQDHDEPFALQEPGAEAIDLADGYPSAELLPLRAVRAALARAARGEHATRRAPSAGLPELRAWIAADLASRAPGGAISVGPRNAIVLPGSQAGLVAVFRAVAGPGGSLLVESPSYWGARLAAAQGGVTLVPVASGPQGPDPEEVGRALRSSGAAAFYAQPSFANPHGGLWPHHTRTRVLELMREHGTFLIEDEWAADFAIDADPVPVAAGDTDGHVIGLRSFTKSVSPALRVASVTARGPVRERILAEVRAQAMYVSPLLQAALLEVVTQPAWGTHRRSLRRALGERRDLLAASLAAQAPSLSVHVPSGGLHLWARLPQGLREEEVAAACARRGLRVFTGRRAFPAEATGNHLRLGFAAARPADFSSAAAILGEALARP